MSPPEPARASASSTARHSPLASLLRGRWVQAAVAGIGGFATVFLLAWAQAWTSALLLIAPFGASCVLVFALPQSPLAQPRNVIGGHLVSTLAGLCVLHLVGPSPIGLALGVGIAIASMLVTDTLHPPAGADPIVVMTLAAPWTFLGAPVFVGALAIVVAGAGFHRFISGQPYPMARRKP